VAGGTGQTRLKHRWIYGRAPRRAFILPRSDLRNRMKTDHHCRRVAAAGGILPVAQTEDVLGLADLTPLSRLEDGSRFGGVVARRFSPQLQQAEFRTILYNSSAGTRVQTRFEFRPVRWPVRKTFLGADCMRMPPTEKLGSSAEAVAH